ncbi:MAG: LCP family protein [Acidimicrobiia bacterium]
MTTRPGPGGRPLPSPRGHRPKPLVAALLSAVVPGLGHLYAGDRKRGWWCIGITAVFVVPAAVLFALVFYVTGVDLALDLARPFFESPSLLLALLAVNFILVAFRAAAVVDSFMYARNLAPDDRPITLFGLSFGVAVILIVTAIPHGWVGERNLALHDLLTHDFTTDPNQVTTTAVVPTTTIPATTIPGATTTSTTTPPTTTTTTRPDPFDGEDRVNVLLLGSDAGPGRTGVRTDTMIVVSIDPETGWTAMFSIPRNFVRTPIPADHPAYSEWPDGLWGDPSNLVWGIYAYGLQNPALFDGANTGGDAAKTIFGHLVGLEIDYFAMVNLHGFVDMIDALGGVEIHVTRRIYDAEYPHEDGYLIEIEFLPGTYRMNGHDALAFARTRHDADDFDRMGRQRCVLEALAREADPVSLLRELPSLVPAIESSVITDIPVARFPDFLSLLAKVDTEQIVSMRFIPNAPEFAGTTTSYVAYQVEGYNVPNVDLIRDRVQIATTLPPLEAAEALNLQPLDEVCGVPDGD